MSITVWLLCLSLVYTHTRHAPALALSSSPVFSGLSLRHLKQLHTPPPASGHRPSAKHEPLKQRPFAGVCSSRIKPTRRFTPSLGKPTYRRSSAAAAAAICTGTNTASCAAMPRLPCLVLILPWPFLPCHTLSAPPRDGHFQAAQSMPHVSDRAAPMAFPGL